jgi:ribosomal protein L3 glutamine methyltransferase
MTGFQSSRPMTNETTDVPAQEVLGTLHTALDFLRYGVSAFERAGLHYGHGTDNALDEARLLLCHALHLPMDAPDLLFDGRLLAHEKSAVLELLSRRIAERRPAAYLTGEAWFAGLPFHVDERVIVPRSPIGELVQTGFAPWIDEPERVHRVLDMCTGSGCIAIACAFAFPNARVDGVDVSGAALEVAARNVARHEVGGRVELVESDLFDGLDSGRRYDLIVCNPPYVGAAELGALPAEYAAEPVLALAGGEDGLALVERILAGAARQLADDGVLVLELGNSAGAAAQRWPALPFTWLEFALGGHGVALLHAGELQALAADGGLPSAAGAGCGERARVG